MRGEGQRDPLGPLGRSLGEGTISYKRKRKSSILGRMGVLDERSVYAKVLGYDYADEKLVAPIVLTQKTPDFLVLRVQIIQSYPLVYKCSLGLNPNKKNQFQKKTKTFRIVQ